MRPTGKLHLGNFLGALSNWVKLQDEYECFYMVADWHALTTEYARPGEIKNLTREMLIDWFACGMDPEKSTVFVQSQLPQHAELHLILSMFIPLSWLERCPTYKQQQQELKDKDLSTYGFLGYPVLQAADILVYRANAVPVGEDQLPHLELTREIARRFNYLYGKVFPEPQALLTKFPRLPGTDGRKMSKSYNNCIYLSDEPDVIRKKISLMVTDPARIHPKDLGHPQVCTVFTFHQSFNLQESKSIENLCRKGEIGCVECKKKLNSALLNTLTSVLTKRKEIEKHPEVIEKVIQQGRKRASSVAQETLALVRQAMGL